MNPVNTISYCILLITAAAFVFVGINIYDLADCLNEDDARTRVEKYLSRKNLPHEQLSLETSDTNVCAYTYSYKYKDVNVSFWVVDDGHFGVDFHVWENEE